MSGGIEAQPEQSFQPFCYLCCLLCFHPKPSLKPKLHSSGHNRPSTGNTVGTQVGEASTQRFVRRLSYQKPQNPLRISSIRTFRGATEPSQPDLPLCTRPPPPRTSPHGTNAAMRTRFWPDFDPIPTRNLPFQVRIRSKSGPNQVRGERFGGGRVQRGRSGWEGSVAPPESLESSRRKVGHKYPKNLLRLFLPQRLF